MYPKKIHYGDSTQANKRSPGEPAESRGRIGTRSPSPHTHTLATSLVISVLNQT